MNKQLFELLFTWEKQHANCHSVWNQTVWSEEDPRANTKKEQNLSLTKNKLLIRASETVQNKRARVKLSYNLNWVI